ncbi:MAG: copper chaperone PCu(A)C [Pseudomonadota bacterium]
MRRDLWLIGFALSMCPVTAVAGQEDHIPRGLDRATQVVAQDAFSTHVSVAAGVRIIHAWTRATDGDAALVFMDIENGSDGEVRLLGGAAEIATAVQLAAHDFRNPGDRVDLEALPISEGQMFPLTPETVFLELRALSGPLTRGDGFEMHVILDPIGEVAIHVEVEASDASNHSHAGHAH